MSLTRFIKVAAKLKDIAMQKQALEPVLCENDLLPDIDMLFENDLDEALLSNYKLARAQANTLLGSQPWSCGEELVERLDEKRQLLCQLDAAFSLDIEMFRALVGDVGKDILAAMILQSMPAAYKQKYINEVAVTLQELEAQGVYRFCNASAKGCLKMAKDIVGSLQMKMPPPCRAKRATASMRPWLARSSTSWCMWSLQAQVRRPPGCMAKQLCRNRSKPCRPWRPRALP